MNEGNVVEALEDLARRAFLEDIVGGALGEDVAVVAEGDDTVGVP